MAMIEKTNWIFFLLCIITIINSHSIHPKLLLIVLDGFRHDYIDTAKSFGKLTPTFDKIANEGSQAPYIKCEFISRTYPNLFSMVTGLHPENHGVVDNIFYDPENDSVFDMDNSAIQSNQYWWNNGSVGLAPEPIWITNQKGHQTHMRRHSGTIFWPGSEAGYKRMHPYFMQRYDEHDHDFSGRVDLIVDWFTASEDPINLGLLYIEEPDLTGHKFGPDSDAVINKVLELDAVIGRLLDNLMVNNLLDEINIIITSDHGMTATSQNKIIKIAEHINLEDIHYYGSGPTYGILPLNGTSVDTIYEKLNGVAHMNVYKKEEVPQEYHFRYNRRIMPLIVQADEGWIIMMNNSKQLRGAHGYNNSLMSMHPFFLARGPAIRPNFTSMPFNLVDIYPMMCSILGIEAEPNDASLDIIGKMLVKVEPPVIFAESITFLTIIGAFIFAGCISGLVTVVVCHGYCRRKSKSYGISLNQAADGQCRPLNTYSDDSFDEEL